MTEKEQELASDMREHGVVSDCCGAEIYMGDLCGSCFEHCEAVPEEGCLNCGEPVIGMEEFCCDDCRKIYYE